jgi:HEAT repeats
MTSPWRIFRTITCVLVLVLAPCSQTYAQQCSIDAPLDEATVARVDVLYPGFGETLEIGDDVALDRLGMLLAHHGTAESVDVLLWMMRHCQWDPQRLLHAVKAVTTAGRLPFAPIADALLRGSPEQKADARFLIQTHAPRIAESDHALVDQTIALLSRNDLAERSAAVSLLMARKSPQLKAAIDDVRRLREEARLASLRPPQLPRQKPDESTFPAASVALLKSIEPRYQETLGSLDEPAIHRLLKALRQAKDPAAIPLLLWLLSYGDPQAYGDIVVSDLAHLSATLPLARLTALLATSDDERRALVADLLARVVGERRATIPSADRRPIISSLIECLASPHVPLRRQAILALGAVRAVEAVSAIELLLAEPEGEVYQDMAVRALSRIGAPTALPVLGRLARSGRWPRVRDDARNAYLWIAKPADPGAVVRRLTWEQPDTELERRVLAGGRARLPEAWAALATGSPGERRVAAALLGWVRDVRSIGPILRALDASPGALTREQLLFDLNMILLTEAPEAPNSDRDALARLHLQTRYEDLINQPGNNSIGGGVAAQKTIPVFPDRVNAPFSVALSGSRQAAPPSQQAETFSATAVRSSSANAFLDAVQSRCGVAFHAITTASGVARVASAMYCHGGSSDRYAWVTLYRRDEGRWVPLAAEGRAVSPRVRRDSNLLPTINRDYGGNHPLKFQRLDIGMEHARVNVTAPDSLSYVNRDNPIRSTQLDASFVPLLERYRRSDSAAVRFTAELELTRLTRQPNLQFWIDALSQQQDSHFQQLTRSVFREHIYPRVRNEGTELEGAARETLIESAMTVRPALSNEFPSPPPDRNEIKWVKQWTRFGVVDIHLRGQRGRSASGYSLLFERREGRWSFVGVMITWIE